MLIFAKKGLSRAHGFSRRRHRGDSTERAKSRLSRLQVEGLRPLFTGSHLELHLVAFAEILELNLRAETRAVEEHVVAAVVGLDESESLVLDDLLDTASHR